MSDPLDGIDQRIVDALVQDARLSVRELAESLHVSRANTYTRLKRLQSSGVIRGFRADIDPVAYGLETSAYITLSVDQTRWRAIRERLRSLPSVVHMALVGGEFDVILLVRTRDNASLRDLVLEGVQEIPGVRSTRTLLIFDEPQPMSSFGA